MKIAVRMIGSKHINNPLKKYKELSLFENIVFCKKQSNDIKLSVPYPKDDISLRKLSNSVGQSKFNDAAAVITCI
jgi:hypothetical protein